MVHHQQHTLSCVLVCVRLSVFQTSSAPDDQFNAFVAIRDQFLLSTSPEEVNISSVMNKQLMSFTTRCSTGHEAVAKAEGFGPKQFYGMLDGPFMTRSSEQI